MIAARRFAIMNPVHTTNFIPEIEGESCNGCGKMRHWSGPVEAMSLISANAPHRPKMKLARLEEDLCFRVRPLCPVLPGRQHSSGSPAAESDNAPEWYAPGSGDGHRAWETAALDF